MPCPARRSRPEEPSCVRSYSPVLGRAGPVDRVFHRPRLAAPGERVPRVVRVRGASDADRKQCQDGGRQEPPCVHALFHEQRGEPDRGARAHGERQVVADEEAPPEESEAPQVAHAVTRSSGFAVRTMAADPSSRNTTIAGSDASPPGQSTPTPSPAQKMPNEVSMIPTANLSAFSGTRASGARTTKPTATTTATAARAASAASQIRCWAAPNVSTMNTTSRPSSKTPLNESVNEYQSIAPADGSPARSAASTSRLYADASSRLALRPAARRIAL